MENTRDLAFNDYLSGMKYKDIAEKYGVSLSTIKAWAVREWKKVAQPNKTKKAATSKEKLQPSEIELQIEKRAKKGLDRNNGLTEKQKIFCLHYIKSFNPEQSYKKAYGGDLLHARDYGWKLLQNDVVRAEITRLKEMLNSEMLADASALVDFHMKIAFSDLTDFVEFESETALGKTKNVVRFKNSNDIDGRLLNEVRQGKDGASVKLVDRQKSLDFLERWFTANPMDKHKMDYDNRRLKLEQEKLGSLDNFIKEIEDLTPLAELLNNDNTESDN